MGNNANVPIEPDIQTRIANATMELPGVVAAGTCVRVCVCCKRCTDVILTKSISCDNNLLSLIGVPGAGGYDALFVLYIRGKEHVFDHGRSSDETRDGIGQMWLHWCDTIQKEGGDSRTICPLACKSVGFGGVHGIHVSDLDW